MTVTPSDAKACCATSYAGAAARFLLGDSFHPGGLDLTRELLALLGLERESVLLDLASGPGTSALLAAREHGCSVIGIDLSEDNAREAATAAREAGLDGVSFRQGDAEAIPLDDATVDAVLCECALCLFPDKPAAAAEIARVLRPGGRLALSDVTADPGRLPDELRTLAAWASCVADARPLDEIASILTRAGLRVVRAESRNVLALGLVDRIEGRLRVARMMRSGVPADLRDRAESGLRLTAAARAAIATGALGYGLLLAER